jgi:hypothetical protein
MDTMLFHMYDNGERSEKPEVVPNFPGDKPTCLQVPTTRVSVKYLIQDLTYSIIYPMEMESASEAHSSTLTNAALDACKARAAKEAK